ncbi:MAG: hypothetical protein FD145_228 [Candidatus Saganbacteria bacterium]|uniref:Uncharacterized protein n=1 Tax=Candidatus Saganbacteria bacterium TaxID=2575572 RepID=A0A833P0G0_UNCSA|nr:MAG: hypothetical protein FD145_228 [Candidatus Saganbacteria bacterium]
MKTDLLNMFLRVIFCLMFMVFLINSSSATPSTQIWNPSTDIQANKSWHLGIDNYFTIDGPLNGGYAFPTDIGLTYGVILGFEIGVDVFLPQTSPLSFNAKYGITEADNLPAIAIGGFGFGTQVGVTDQNVLYVIAAKTFIFGRISTGYFKGNPTLLGSDGFGMILTWDKSLTDKIWASIDFASGNTTLGSLFAGFSYAFSKNTSVIFGYGTYSNGAKPTITTQLDINI